MTQQEVADRFGLSRQRIDQIEDRDSSRQETSSEESDPTLTLLRELQCRLEDLATLVAHLIERTTP